MIGEIVTLVVMVALIVTMKQMLGMLLEHLHKRQVAEQDHQERMKTLAQEHAVRVAEMTPAGVELEVRSVFVEVHASSADFIRFFIAELERTQLR